MITELKRKLFHLTALVYVIGVLTLPRNLFILAIGILLALNVAVEILRLTTPAVARFFSENFGVILRAEENNRLTGVFWMLLGVLVTALLIPSDKMAAVVFLYVILGDGVASLAGKGLGGPHWPGSDKRVSGSAACFAVCLIVGAVMLRPDFGWYGIFLGAAAATLLEFGLIRLNDNFTIPAGSSLALLLVYGINPYVLSL